MCTVNLFSMPAKLQNTSNIIKNQASTTVSSDTVEDIMVHYIICMRDEYNTHESSALPTKAEVDGVAGIDKAGWHQSW